MPTPQEQFWRGEEGWRYTARNGTSLLPAKVAFFERALQKAEKIGSAIEFGANRGLNLTALEQLYPGQYQAAVEINWAALQDLVRECGPHEIHDCSLLQFEPPRQYDLSLTMGVLIHLAERDLPRAYDVLHKASSRYILVAEYFSETPVEVRYRGYDGVLFKRNFGAEIEARFPDLKRIDQGFAGKDVGQDDLTWWLWEKAT